jgi:hypothetical protein
VPDAIWKQIDGHDWKGSGLPMLSEPPWHPRSHRI